MAKDGVLASDVLVPVYAFLDGLAQKSKALMMQQVLPDGWMVNLRATGVRHVQFETLIELMFHVYEGKEIAEPIEQPIVHVDETVAVVWAPYQFIVDGRVQHSGTNVFSLLKLDSTWTIVCIADNARPL